MMGQPGRFVCFLVATLLCLFPLFADAVQYTIGIPIGQQRCLSFMNTDVGGKVALYFAALNGGESTVPFSVVAASQLPGSTVEEKKNVFSAADKRTGDYVFTLQQLGRYDVCFMNDRASVQLLLDVDFIIEDKQGIVRHLKDELAHHNQKPTRDIHNSAAIDDSMYKIQGGLHSAARSLKYMKTREARSMETVVSTESRIFWFSLFESALIVAMAALQVFAVRKLFDVPKAKGRV